MASIKKQPSGRWRAQIRRKGHRTISKTFRTRQLAQAWAITTEDMVERGDTIDKDITIVDLLDKYEREIAQRKKGYMNSERYRLETLRGGLSGLSINALSPTDIMRYADQRLLTVSSDTIRRELGILSSALVAARNLWGYPLKVNPVQVASNLLSSTNTLKRQVERNRRVSDDELSLLHSTLSETMADIVDFAIESAMRCGEIASLGKRINEGLLIEDDKSGKTTVIPLSKRANEILDKYPSGFNRESNSISQAFNRGCKRVGIKDLRFHDLRHEATSRLFEKGLAIEEVAKITRHSDWRSLKRYTHPSNELISQKLG